MASERILIVAGDGPVARRVSQQLSDLEIDFHWVDPDKVDLDEGDLFQAAFDHGATAVLLVEPLQRWGATSPPPRPDLVRAAMAASRAPGVTALGWVTQRAADDEAIGELRRSGKPYGVLQVGPILELAVDEGVAAGQRRTVLASGGLCDAAAQARAATIAQVASEVTDWIESEAIAAGRLEPLTVPDRPLEQLLERQGFEPLHLSPWRVGLNAFFGMLAVDLDRATGTLVVRRRPLRRLSEPHRGQPLDDTKGMAGAQAAPASS